MTDFWRRVLAAVTHSGPRHTPAATREAALRAALATLAERWEQIATSAEKAITLDGTYDPTRPAQGERIRTYRKTAADVRDVLRTDHVPHDLMTSAELEQHGTSERTAL